MKRDPFERSTCPDCGRSVAIVRALHHWSRIFTVRSWHLTPDRKRRCRRSSWGQGD